jgi:hypothetical protein
LRRAHRRFDAPYQRYQLPRERISDMLFGDVPSAPMMKPAAMTGTHTRLLIDVIAA